MSVTFNGNTKRINISIDMSILSVKDDLYSEWKRWAVLNPMFPPAFRTIGGDPIGSGQFAGDMYFLMNGWQIIIDHEIELNGVLYHDDSIDPYILESGGALTIKVSSLVQTVSTAGSDISEITIELEKIKRMIADTQAFVLAQ